MGSIPIGISGSRAAAVLGLTKWRTPVQVWLSIREALEPGFCESHGFEPPEFQESAPLRWGLAFEGAVIDLAEEATTDDIVDRELAVEHPDHDFITAHIDGRYQETGALHEGKTTSAQYFFENFGEPGSDRVPREYQIQVQHQMLCTGADRAILSVLVFPRRVDEFEAMGWEIRDAPAEGYELHHIPTEENGGAWILDPIDFSVPLSAMGYFHQYEIDANPELQALMLDTYVEWWRRYVLGDEVPPAETYDDIKNLCPSPRGTVIADERVERLSAEYKQINKEFRSISKRKDQIKTSILDSIIGGAEHPIDDDSVEAIVLRDRNGKKLHTYSKGKRGLLFR